jgi:hypothetical protein
MPKAGRRSAHRRLAEIQPVAGARHTALGEQGVESDEQVQIEEMQVR